MEQYRIRQRLLEHFGWKTKGTAILGHWHSVTPSAWKLRQGLSVTSGLRRITALRSRLWTVQSTATYLHPQRTQRVEPLNTLNARKLFSRAEHVERVGVLDRIENCLIVGLVGWSRGCLDRIYRIDRIKMSVKMVGAGVLHDRSKVRP